MSAPEILTVEDCFAAAPNAEAVRQLREWCDRTESAAKTAPLSFADSEPVFQARMQLVDEVRAMLPAVSTEDPSP